MAFQHPSNLVFIDSAIEDLSVLIDGVSNTSEIILLDPEQEGISQITRVIRSFKNVESIHIISHGVPGALHLGTTELNSQTLTQAADLLKEWSALANQAELLIYGCKVALGEVGRAFVQKFSDLTGMAIAASTTLTGSAALGGNWELEMRTGRIKSSLAFREEAIASYAYVFAPDALPNLVYTIAGTTISVTSTVMGTSTTPTNPLTGATVSNTLSFTTNANARDPFSPSELLYYISADGSNSLGSWNPITGVSSVVATISGANLDASPRMAFRDNGQLYVMTGNVLYTVSTGTGLGTGNTLAAGTVTSNTTLTGIATGGGGDMAFDPANPNILYVAGTGSTSLYKVTFTGATPSNGTLLGSMGGSSPGLAFGFDGKLYSSDGTALYTVNLTTGARTLVGNPGGGISDMASLPTPTTDVDLSVTITDSNTIVPQGGSITYTITVTNSSAFNVYGISIADTFTNPSYSGTASWTAVAATGVSFRTPSDQTGTGDMNVKVNLAAGASVTYTVTGLTATGAIGNSFTDTVTVTPPEGLTDKAGNPGANTAIDSTTIAAPDTTAPVMSVDFLTTNDNTPQLTGQVDDFTAIVKVTVNGTTYTATNNGDGTWTLPDNAIASALADGKYDVTAVATDAAGNMGTEATTQELTVDTTAPIVSVNTLVTNDSTPKLTGTIDDPTAVVKVTVNGTTYTATNNGDGTWTLPDNAIAPALADGKYDVTAVATDAAGNTGTEATTQELTVDTTAPIVSVNTLTTKDSTPQLKGTVDDPTAVVKVTVNSLTYTATNNGDGTWTLPDNAIAPALADGKYDVTAVATDAVGNMGTEATTQELSIDATAPIVSVNPLTTNDSTPQLTGTVNDATAVVKVTVNGLTYTATNNGDGTWTLPDNTIPPALADGKYDVTAVATDAVGNIGTEATTQELTVDTKIPAISVTPVTTNDSTPQLTGTVNDPTAVVEITVNGTTYTATNKGNGTWTLPNNTIATSLADGTYDVVAAATNSLGNTGVDTTNNELTINSAAPSIAVIPLTTKDSTPKLMGTVSDPAAVVKLTINGLTYTATNKGDGTWTLLDNTIAPALADGKYNVAATATDALGNTGTDATTNELTIDATAPLVAVNPLTTKDSTPVLTGTVDDPTAIVRVVVSGTTYTAINNGNGTWTLPDNTIAPMLANGTYDVTAVATDTLGNAGTDPTNKELIINTAAITVAIAPLKTSDTTPQLTGTISSPTASVVVTVNGVDYNATNNGNSTWTLLDNAITTPLIDGTYDVKVTATDAIGNTGIDPTSKELTIDQTPPVVAVTPLTTTDKTPKITGTVDDPTAVVTVTVNGTNYTATNNGNGTWTLSDNTITTPLANGTYDIKVAATDSLGNVGTDKTTNELTISPNTPPVVETASAPITRGAAILISGLIGNDPGGSVVSYTIATLPDAAQGTLYLGNPGNGGTLIMAGQTLSPDQAKMLYFQSSSPFTGAKFTYTATDDMGSVSTTPATVNLDFANIAPTVSDVSNSNSITPGSTTALSGLSGQDPDGTIASYTIASLPESSEGSLYLGSPDNGGVPVKAGQILSLADIGRLFFKASSTFKGSSFAYATTDDVGATSIKLGTVTLGISKTMDLSEEGCSTDQGITRRVRGGRSRGKRSRQTLIGTPNRDRLTGSRSNDRIYGGKGIDTLLGGRGKDRLFGDECSDLLKGGSGNDILKGGSGNDKLDGNLGRDRLFGGSGNDVLKGGIGKDRLTGGLGNDRLFGGRGNDRLKGGSGDDNLNGNRGNDRLFGNGGDDFIKGGLDNDLIKGGAGNDKLSGGQGDDWLGGNRGQDTLSGGRGNDRLQGGQGDDVLKGSLGNDRLNGGSGGDRLNGGRGDDLLKGGSGDDTLKGSQGQDTLKGGSGNDLLMGGFNNDVLLGGGSDDVLVGGIGSDILTGGQGNDRFVYRDIKEQGDRITDFQMGQDVIDLSQLFAKKEYTSANPLQDYVKLAQTGSRTVVQIDSNGNAAGGLQNLVTLENVDASRLSSSAFLV